MSLDPPYRLRSDAVTHRFIGWTEVDDPEKPDIKLTLNGIEAPLTLKWRPDVVAQFPDTIMQGFFAQVDFRELLRPLADGEISEPFLLEAKLTSGHRRRTFEYAVTEQWLESLFERPLRARRIPPEHLQIRVSGSAAGEFHGTGERVAKRIAALLRGYDRPLQDYGTILDFGSGPGRVLDAVRDLHPHAQLYGVDIDAEAIGWARTELPEVADFQVVGPTPPLPFPKATFDLIVCISVFTHLPENMQSKWLSELRRVLKPGGILLTTKLNPDNDYVPSEVRAKGLSRGFAYWEMADVTAGLPGFYRLAYHTEDYVRRQWGRYFEVLHVGSRNLNDTQDAVLMRRPCSTVWWMPRRGR